MKKQEYNETNDIILCYYLPSEMLLCTFQPTTYMKVGNALREKFSNTIFYVLGGDGISDIFFPVFSLDIWTHLS